MSNNHDNDLQTLQICFKIFYDTLKKNNFEETCNIKIINFNELNFIQIKNNKKILDMFRFCNIDHDKFNDASKHLNSLIDEYENRYIQNLNINEIFDTTYNSLKTLDDFIS